MSIVLDMLRRSDVPNGGGGVLDARAGSGRGRFLAGPEVCREAKLDEKEEMING